MAKSLKSLNKVSQKCSMVIGDSKLLSKIADRQLKLNQKNYATKILPKKIFILKKGE